MEKYNIETLSFLIGSFRDIIQSFGQNSKSVEFYKRQVGQLVNIGQVCQYDADLVEELVGMRNTDAVKWDKATEKIEQFIKSIDSTYSIKDNLKRVIMLEQFEREGYISKSVKETVYRVYNIDIKGITNEINNAKTIGFGEIPSNKKQNTKKKEESRKSNKPTVSSIEKQLTMLRIVAGSNDIIRVRNTEAVCSADPTYFRCKIIDIEKSLHILSELANGCEYEVGCYKKYRYDDPCGRCDYFAEIPNKDKLIQIIDSIDWKEVYERASRQNKV